jgi:putative transposase
MARPLRIEYPGACYHLINRGNAGDKIFKTIRDREMFLEYLAKAVERFDIVIHTYCLMSNHYHIIVETPQANLSAAIQWLNVSYATYYNKKRQRSGHLFQGRFKALLVDADEYLSQLSRYIHLNPVRARMVDAPADYRWSSYPAFIGKTKEPQWLDTGLLAGFGKKRRQAERNYQSFVEEIDPKDIENPNSQVVEGFIMGGPEFVTWVQKRFLSAKKEDKEIPQLSKLKPRISLDSIVKVVCNEMGCTPDDIKVPGRKKNLPREVAIYLARWLSGISCTAIGQYFGSISGAAVTMRYDRFSNELSKDKKGNELVIKLKRQIFNI